MRFDNGLPWGTASPVPSALALWLAGLDIQPLLGRPGRSTDNAVVERAHGVLNGWVQPAQCATFEQLGTQLARFVTLQREQYPVTEGRSRLQCYPALTTVQHPYDPVQDELLWSEQAMFDHLATWRFRRKVELNGRLTLLNREYSVGRDYKRRTLTIQLDATTHHWVVYEEDDREIRRLVPKDLDYTTLFHMTLAFRRRGKTQ